MVQAGEIVILHGLTSTSGKKINGNRALVLGFVEEKSRWQIRIECDAVGEKTKAIKDENLRGTQRLPLPTGFYRGFATHDHMESLIPKLCELLVSSDENYEPSEIMFRGYAHMALDRMGGRNLMHYTADQMEQMGGVLALANLCRESDEPGTAAVAFGLLEGNSMYLDVFITTLTRTPLIVGQGQPIDRAYADQFEDCPPTQLAPDQDAKPYIRTMSEGPILLLQEMCKYVFGKGLWTALKRSEFYHLLVQRLLRLAAREALGTNDGLGLGSSARVILTHMVPLKDNLLRGAFSQEQAQFLLNQVGGRLDAPGNVTAEAIQQMLELN